MSEPFNPYIAGSPLRNRGFFGRQETLKKIVRKLHHPEINALLFFGQRGIGKTSFLYQLEQALLNNAFLPVYINLQNVEIYSVGEILEELAYEVSKVATIAPPDVDAFDNQGRFFQDTFLPQLQKKLANKRRLVFLLDEFDTLESVLLSQDLRQVVKALFSVIRRLMSVSNWAAFLFMMGKGEEELSSDFTVIFKDAQMREVLWLLSPESAEQLIRQAESNDTLQFTDEAVARILTLTNCHPYLTQLLCENIWERVYANLIEPTIQPLIDMPDVEDVIPSALSHGEQKLRWWWNGLTLPERIYAAAMAEMSAENKSIAKESVMQELSHIALQLPDMELAARALLKRRVFTVTAMQKYRFSIELFHRWVHKERLLQYELAKLSSTIPQSTMAKIRQTLNMVFDDPGLSAFCLDYFEDVYDQFSEGMRKDYKITLLLDHCRRRPTGLERLLALVPKEYTYPAKSDEISDA